MKIILRLSKRINVSGMSEILLSANNRIGDKVVTVRAKSEIFVMPAFFSPEKGVDMSRKKLIAPDIRIWHNNAKKRLDDLLSDIAKAEIGVKKCDITGDWLSETVSRSLHPERYEHKQDVKTIYEYGEDYIKIKNFSKTHIRTFKVVLRTIARYEGFRRATDKQGTFTFDINTLTRDDIEDFKDYIRNEASLSQEHPELFRRLLNDNPVRTLHAKKEIELRGENYIITFLKRLKAFCNWMLETGRTSNNPFRGVTIGTQKYGTPYYITIEERNVIADTPMPTRHLETQRDIFVFQCFVGCRVSDLMKLTKDNITDGILTYTPHKTKDEGVQAVIARVPLHHKAVELIRKYEGVDSKGRLFPFISAQKYNDSIKEIFTIAGITRNVEVRNSLTGEIEIRPINEVASSHLARRTFVGNAYRHVSDPNIIGKMSGHVEGSKAFSRYRNIEDETLKKVIDSLG